MEQPKTPQTPGQQRRFADRVPQNENMHRRSTDPQRRGSDPDMTRKGFLSHPGTILMGLGGLVFAAYIFNVGGTGSYLDSMFTSWDTSAQAQNHKVQAWVEFLFPYVVAVLVVIVLYAVIKAIGRGASSYKTTHKLAPRKEITVQEFTEHVAVKGISPKVAKEAFKLLLPFYRNRMRTRLTDSLTETLQLKRPQIADLYQNLLYHTDRHAPIVDNADEIDTVLQLLTLVEQARPRSSNEAPFIPPVARRKGLSRLTGIFIPPARLKAAREAAPAKTSDDARRASDRRSA